MGRGKKRKRRRVHDIRVRKPVFKDTFIELNVRQFQKYQRGSDVIDGKRVIWVCRKCGSAGRHKSVLGMPCENDPNAVATSGTNGSLTSFFSFVGRNCVKKIETGVIELGSFLVHSTYRVFFHRLKRSANLLNIFVTGGISIWWIKMILFLNLSRFCRHRIPI